MPIGDVELFFLLSSAFLAGLVDAVGGGGGLIQLPALLVWYPNAPLPLLFGTNKFASAWGTGLATVRMARNVKIPWHSVTSATVAAFIFSFVGAKCTSLLNPAFARPLIVVMLALVLVYTVARPKLGSTHAVRFSQTGQRIAGFLTGALLGFYDGIFGPGTGSFIIFALISVLGFDFLRASAGSKVINLATNVAALCYFIPAGYVNYSLGVGMAACNMLGAMIGAHLALSRGSMLIRIFFIVMATALLAKQIVVLWQ